MYIEAEKHLLNIYTSDGSKPYVIGNTLDQTMEDLPRDQFVRCYRGYIVNMKYIRSVYNNMISLKNSNAILPVVTYVGPMLAYTLTGSFIVEKIFTIPGLGGEFISAITNRDYMMIMGTTIFLAALVIVMNVIVDIVYTIVDPRIKLK